jgi:hypothetical protein
MVRNISASANFNVTASQEADVIQGEGGSGDLKSRSGQGTLIPVSVGMVKASKVISKTIGKIGDGFLFQLEDGRILHLVRLVVAIREKYETQAHHHYMVEDGTGLIDVYVDKNELFNFKKSEYVKIVGTVESFRNKKGENKNMIMAKMLRSLSTGDELTHHILEVTYSHAKTLDRKLPAKSNLKTTLEAKKVFVPPPAAVQHFASAPPSLVTPASKRNFRSTVTPDIRNQNVADVMTRSIATQTTFEETSLFVPPQAAVQHFASATPSLVTPASKRNFKSNVTPDIRDQNVDAMTHRLGTDNLESGQDNLGFNDNLGSTQDKDDENLESDKDDKDDQDVLGSDNETSDLESNLDLDNLSSDNKQLDWGSSYSGSIHDHEKEDFMGSYHDNLLGDTYCEPLPEEEEDEREEEEEFE